MRRQSHYDSTLHYYLQTDTGERHETVRYGRTCDQRSPKSTTAEQGLVHATIREYLGQCRSSSLRAHAMDYSCIIVSTCTMNRRLSSLESDSESLIALRLRPTHPPVRLPEHVVLLPQRRGHESYPQSVLDGINHTDGLAEPDRLAVSRVWVVMKEVQLLQIRATEVPVEEVLREDREVDGYATQGDG